MSCLMCSSPDHSVAECPMFRPLPGSERDLLRREVETLREALRSSLNREKALEENLTTTQKRCTELLEEARASKRDLAEMIRYIDDAKIEAQKLGRAAGEPLDAFLRSLAEQR